MDEAQKLWYRQRIDAIHARVSAFDVLRANGVSLGQAADDGEEQFSCPFHGKDAKPSARVYPAKAEHPSHVWCFVCQEKNWDAIGLWRKFNGARSFGQALFGIERAYGLATPEMPAGTGKRLGDIEVEDRFKKLYVVCENRLLVTKHAYRQADDLHGYLAAGSVLDRTKYRVDNGQWDSDRGVAVLRTLLERMRERERDCPVG